MNAKEYKHIDINGVSIAYTDSGEGQPVLFIHGFASYSFTWMKMLGYMPKKLRYITIDLKGYGYSEKRCDDQLSPFDQSLLVAEFIRRLKLENLVLVGHSMGGAISLLTLFNGDISAKTAKLILLDSAGFLQKLPDFIDDITETSPDNAVIKMANEELLVSLVLKQTFYDHNKIDKEAVGEYSAILRQPNAKECLYASARQIAIANTKSFHEKIRALAIPTLIIWGKEDTIIYLSDALKLKADIKDSKLRIIPKCGHSPQEEMPMETAEMLSEFIGVNFEAATASTNQGINPPHKIKMRRLVDNWSVGMFFMILFIKFLQFLKVIGFKAKENGWRKVAGIFMRQEHSKFILASFRISYIGEENKPADMQSAKTILLGRLADFIRKNPAYHWTIDWGFFMARRKKLILTDLVEAEISSEGRMLKLIPHLDRTSKNFPLIKDETMAGLLAEMIEIYNGTGNISDRRRSWIIYKRLRRWVRRAKGLSFSGRHELRKIIDRLMNSTFIQFDVLTNDPSKFTRSRMATPDMRRCSHPGFGLLNIVCRFTADYSECDLWFQYHHVSVDGMPMQEMLQDLKKEWGSAGPVKYPALTSSAAKPESLYHGHNLFRARVYVSFGRFLKFRKFLNEKYYVEMGGPATVSSMIIWGFAQQEYFRELKFISPVDSSLIMDPSGGRNISFIIIRPKKFFNAAVPLDGFLKYQKEFNQRLFATSIGKSETHELLELYALTHPLFYQLTNKVMSKTMGELVGTAGLTILKNAEMFISPISDLHVNGFVSIGNMAMPTEDGKAAGAVSICGSREQIHEYIKAINRIAENYHEFLLLNSP
jgi:pimeloyl-ACP methyl ester carboxylesterase